MNINRVFEPFPFSPKKKGRAWVCWFTNGGTMSSKLICLCAIVLLVFGVGYGRMSGTFVLTSSEDGGGGFHGWTEGDIVLLDAFSGKTDTLVRGKCGGPTFSPDGREIVFRRGFHDWINWDDPINRKYVIKDTLFIINLFTKQVRLTVPNYAGNESADQFTWDTDNCIYYPACGTHRVLRLNLGTMKKDTLLNFVGNYAHEFDTTNYELHWGNMSSDGKRGCFTCGKEENSVVSFDLATGFEGGRSKGNCQAGISINGDFICDIGGSHGATLIHNFVSGAVYSIMPALWLGTVPTGEAVWMLEFSRHVNNMIMFHITDGGSYLWNFKTDRYRLIAKKSGGRYASVWGYYQGWVLDTIPAKPPAGLHAGVITDKQITLNWNAPSQAASDGDMPEWYVVVRDGDTVVTITGTEFTDTALTENTDYSYKVYSKDDGVRVSSPAEGTFHTLVDVSAPVVLRAYSFTDNSVLVQFSENIDRTLAQTPSNYTLDNNVTVQSAVLTDSNTVSLATSSLGSAVNGMITVIGAKDIAVSANTNTSTSCAITAIRGTDMVAPHTYWCRVYWDILKEEKLEWSGFYEHCFHDVPYEYRGLPYLVQCTEDLNVSEVTDYLTFTVNRPIRVYLGAYSVHEADNPAWMRANWQQNGDTLGSYVIYTKKFNANEKITLKGNSDNSLGLYSIMFEPDDSLSNVKNEMVKVLPINNRMELGVYPAPFTSSINITLNLAVKGNVIVRIYDSNGRIVKVIRQGETSSGVHNLVWNGTGLDNERVATGVYFCQAMADKRIVITRMLTLLR